MAKENPPDKETPSLNIGAKRNYEDFLKLNTPSKEPQDNKEECWISINKAFDQSVEMQLKGVFEVSGSEVLDTKLTLILNNIK